jgi:glycosyltransferase involved in cell wall biosynthesis
MDHDEIMDDMTEQTTMDPDQRPEVSVMMITYNQARTIRQALDSVLMQQTNFIFEIVLADDCSTDGTREICLEYRDKYPQQIKLLLHPANLGAIQNSICSIQAVTGKYVAFCEGDDYWIDPLKLQSERDFLEKNGHFTGVHTQVNYIDANDNIIGSSDLIPAHIESVDFNYLVQKNVIHTCSFLFRKSIIDETIDKILNLTPVLDYTLFLAAAYKGRIGYLRKITATYRKNAGITSTWKFANYLNYGLAIYSLFERYLDIKKYRPALYAAKKFHYYHLTHISASEKQPHFLRFKYFFLLVWYSLLNLFLKPADEPNKVKGIDVLRMTSQIFLISKLFRMLGLFRLYLYFKKR